MKEVDCSFLMGTYLEQVHSEVMLKDKELIMNIAVCLEIQAYPEQKRVVPGVLLSQSRV